MSELQVLRTAKQALDEGLIAPEDFDIVKNAFLKAQQIKAGLDAGFIREEEYQRTRDAFLHSLDFRLAHSPQQPDSPHESNGGGNGSGNGTAKVVSASAASARKSGFATPPRAPHASVVVPAASAAATASAVSNGQPAANLVLQSQGGSHPRPECLAPIPTDIPKTAKGNATIGKVSMAGIGVHEDTVNIFNWMKTRSTYKWVIYRIDASGHQVVIEFLGIKDSSYEDFVAALPETECRYGVYDYMYMNEERGANLNKLVFLHWAPEGASIKSKMMYASTKDFVKGFMDGIGADMQASELSELGEDQVREKIWSSLTRK